MPDDDKNLTPLAAQRQISFLTTFGKKFEGFRKEMERLERAVSVGGDHSGRWPTEGLERIARSLVGAGAVYGLPAVTDWARAFLERLNEIRGATTPPGDEDLSWLASKITELVNLQETALEIAEETVEPGSTARRKDQEQAEEQARKSVPPGAIRATPAPFIAPARATDPPPIADEAPAGDRSGTSPGLGPEASAAARADDAAPARGPAPPPLPPLRHTPAPKLERISMKPTALAVSADPAIRRAVSDALGEAGFEVTAVSEAEAALQRATEDAPDVIVLDADDPAPGGATLVHELNRDPLTEFIPVLQVAERAERIRGTGIPKPVEPERLAAEARRLSGRDFQTSRITIGLRDPNLSELTEFVVDEIHEGVTHAVTGHHASDRFRVLGEGPLMASIWTLVAQMRRIAAIGSGGRIRFVPTSSGRAGIMALAEAEEVLDPVTHQELDDSALADLSGLRVVVADDDAEIRVVFDKVLGEVGMRVRTAIDGIEALEAIRENPPDLLVTDILMPGLDGWELCNRLRSDYALRHIPVIILSWKEDFLERLRGLNVGADDFMLKRVDRQQILGRVARVIRPRIVLQHQLESGGSMSGRVERVGVRTILETALEKRRSCRVVLRETWNYFEADIRDGALIAVTCTVTDGTYISGRQALERMLGVSHGRFSVVEPADTPKPQFEQSAAVEIKRACDQLNRYVAQVIDGALLDIAQVELYEEILDLYSQVVPPKLRIPLELLRGGDSPREIILAGTASPDALETLLLDLIRVGAVYSIKAPPPDMSRTPVSRDSVRWRALADGVLLPEEDEPRAERPSPRPITRSSSPLPPAPTSAASRPSTPTPGPIRRSSAPPAVAPLVPPRDERVVSRGWQVLAVVALIALGLSLYLSYRMWGMLEAVGPVEPQPVAEAGGAAPEPALAPEPVVVPEPAPTPEPVVAPEPKPAPEPAVAPESEPAPTDQPGDGKKKKRHRKDEVEPSATPPAPPANPYGEPAAEKPKEAPKEKPKEPPTEAPKEKPKEEPKATPAAAGGTGTLKVAAPADAPGPIKVAVDGKTRGTAPLSLDLEPGLHEVTFTLGGERTLRMVSIKSGQTKTITAKVGQ